MKTKKAIGTLLAVAMVSMAFAGFVAAGESNFCFGTTSQDGAKVFAWNPLRSNEIVTDETGALGNSGVALNFAFDPGNWASPWANGETVRAAIATPTPGSVVSLEGTLITGSGFTNLGGPHNLVPMSIPTSVWNAGGWMDLAWADPGDPLITGYLVYRSDDGGANYNIIAGTTAMVAGNWWGFAIVIERATSTVPGFTFQDATGVIGEWYDYSIRYVYAPDVPTMWHDAQMGQPSVYDPVYSGDSPLTLYGVIGGGPPWAENINAAGLLLDGDHNNLDLTVTADINDDAGDNILAAEFRVDGAAAIGMAGGFGVPGPLPVTGAYNSGVGYFAEGIHNLDVHGQDDVEGWNLTWNATTFNIIDITPPDGSWLTAPGATWYINNPCLFQASYEDFTAYDPAVANSYFEYRVNAGPWQPLIAWVNASFMWGTYTNILEYLMPTAGFVNLDVVDYRGAVQDTAGGGPWQTLLPMQTVTMIDAPPGVQDPYPVYGYVVLYDGTMAGGYTPIPSTGGALVSVSWMNSTTAALSTITYVTNLAGQFSVDILNYTQLDPFGIEVSAVFEAPYNNVGYNWTILDVIANPGGVQQNVTCGIPWNVTIWDPIPLSVVIAGVPFQAFWNITDIGGIIAQGYYTWEPIAAPDNPFSWLAGDPVFIAPAPSFWNGTASAGAGIVAPGQGMDWLTLTGPPICWINITEGGAELPLPDNYLTPWGPITTQINGVLTNMWLKDYDNITLNVQVGFFAWDLVQGWNIVSAPQRAVGYGLNAVFDADDAMNHCFDYCVDLNMAMAQRVLGTNPSTYVINDYGVGELAAFTIDETHAYWVYCSIAPQLSGIVIFNSTNYTTGQWDPTATYWSMPVTTEVGWNLLGFTHNYTLPAWNWTPTASNFTDGTIDPDLDIAGPIFKIVATDWNQAPQWYNSYVATDTFPGMPAKNWAWDFAYAIHPGNGLFLWTDAAITIDYNVNY